MWLSTKFPIVLIAQAPDSSRNVRSAEGWEEAHDRLLVLQEKEERSLKNRRADVGLLLRERESDLQNAHHHVSEKKRSHPEPDTQQTKAAKRKRAHKKEKANINNKNSTISASQTRR